MVGGVARVEEVVRVELVVDAGVDGVAVVGLLGLVAEVLRGRAGPGRR